jgi:hypothetical protein
MAKHSDFQAGFESVIRNTAILDRMLVSAETDYIIGGWVTPVAGSLAIRIGRMWGNGPSLDLPVYGSAVSEPVPVAAPVSGDRVDTVQVKAILEGYDEQRRAFFNPETESGQYFTVPTKMRLKIEAAVLPGAEGIEAAPDAESGWLKLAEILVSPGMAEIPAENIRNVTAIYQGEENAAWTSQKTRTFNLGSTLGLKTMLALEHTVTGEHREKVIRAGNIDFGIGGNRVSAKKIPLGESYAAGTDEFNALDSVFACLVKEAGYRSSNVAALAGAINTINQVIADMVHEAPDDGAVYGRKNKTWAEITGGGGGGILGDAIEALKFYSKKTLMLTNAGIAVRRERGFDLGVPYLNENHEVYHFDTDFNNQNQGTGIALGYAGDAPVLVGPEYRWGDIFCSTAVKEEPPFEMEGRSLLGRFSVSARVSGASCGAEFWARLLAAQNVTLFRFHSVSDEIVLRVGVIDPAYGAEEDGDIPYAASEHDGVPYSVSGTIGDALDHLWQGGSESVNLADKGIEIPESSWLHIAAISTPDTISLFFGERKIDFARSSNTAETFDFEINSEEGEINIDELSLFSGAVPAFSAFAANSAERVPYAALDWMEKWFVLEAQDAAKVKTNLFETEEFKAAVRTVLAEQGA